MNDIEAKVRQRMSEVKVEFEMFWLECPKKVSPDGSDLKTALCTAYMAGASWGLGISTEVLKKH